MKTAFSLQALLVLLLVVLFAGCSFGNDEMDCVEEVVDVKPKRPYDSTKELLIISTLDDVPFSIRDIEGPTFINLWATWCTPCIQEFPSIQEMKREMEAEGWNFIFASTQERSKIKAFQEQNNFDFDFYQLKMPFRYYGVNNIPFTYIVNAKGEVVMNYQGAMDWSTEANKNDLRDLVAEQTDAVVLK